jgi:transposase-like protein
MTTPTQKRQPLPPHPTASTVDDSERNESKSTPVVAGAAPSPEVVEQPTRRQFSAEYKRRILAECDAATAPGQTGQILRREGLWSSHLRDWRAARERGTNAALEPKKRGPKTRPLSAEHLELARLARENARLLKKLQHAELVIDFQKKVSALLGIALPVIEDEADGSDS